MSKKFDTSWFDLSKYDELKNLDLLNWCCQIWARQHLFDYFVNPDNKEFISTDDSRLLLDNMLLRAQSIKSHPIIVDDGMADLYRRDQQELNDGWLNRDAYPFNSHSIRNVTLRDVCFASDYLPDILLDMFGTEEPVLNVDATDEDSELAQKPFSWCLGNLDDTASDYINTSDAYSWVEVNLNASDEQIVKDFQRWLVGHRKAIEHFSTPKNFTVKMFNDWIDWKLLPYIDLMIVAKQEKKSITQSKIARLIFPNEYDVDITERVRRTTKLNAEWLMRWETLLAIHNQVINLPT